MGVETELLGLKNRYDGKEFRIVEREDGTIAVLAGDVVIADSGVLPVTAALSDGGIGKLAGAGGAAPMNLEIGGRRIQLAGAPRSRQKFTWFDPSTGGALNAVPQANCTIVSQGWETYKGEQCYRVTATATDATANAFELLFPTLTEGFSATSIQIEMAFEDCTKFVGVYPFFTTAASNGTYSTYITGSYGGLCPSCS